MRTSSQRYLPITKPMSHPPTKNAAMIGNTMMLIRWPPFFSS